MWPIGVGRVSLTIESRRTAPRRSARTANCGGPSSSGSRSTASTWRSLSRTWESSPTEVNRNYFPSQAQMLWPSWMLPVTKLQMRKTLEFIRIGNMLIWVAFSITLFHSKLLFFLPQVSPLRLEYVFAGRLLVLYAFKEKDHQTVLGAEKTYHRPEKAFYDIISQQFVR